MNSFLYLAAISAVFDRELWAEVPFAFWAVVFFAFGCIVGSFLNVCIHRMPLDQSLISPPSHCPHCRYSIPWYLNVPLVTWLWLRGRCANCKAPISPRYFGVELLTGAAFCAIWLKWGHTSVGISLALCLVLSGFIVATFIDFAHFIIPDEITLGGIGAGCVVSMWLPQLHGETRLALGLLQALVGAGVGWGITYAVLRLGKLLFGKQKIKLEPDTEVIFTEGGVRIGEEETPYEDIFYRPSDEIRLKAKCVRALDKTWENVEVRLSQKRLLIGDESFDPEKVTEARCITDSLTLPREAMGFGDVKFLGAIGAFLGWKGAVFSLMASSVVGALIGLLLIVFRKHEWSSKIPYGPYIALAATVWIFTGPELLEWWARHLSP
jgi:leader peptidase (prepilin peptidase)/N-methyltransferase